MQRALEIQKGKFVKKSFDKIEKNIYRQKYMSKSYRNDKIQLFSNGVDQKIVLAKNKKKSFLLTKKKKTIENLDKFLKKQE